MPEPDLGPVVIPPIDPACLVPTPYERVVLRDGREFVLSRARVRHVIEATILIGQEVSDWREVWDTHRTIDDTSIARKVAIGYDEPTGTYHDAPHLEPWSRTHQ